MTTAPANRLCTAFEGPRCIATGELLEVALKVKEVLDQDAKALVLIFDDETSRPIEVDFRGQASDVAKRLKAVSSNEQGEAPRGPGRPKLGVVAREVTLLPRHWEWLSAQPGGASVSLRKLVEEARRAGSTADRVRLAQESTYRFMSAMAGDLPGFEEAIRAFFAKDAERFKSHMEAWPKDLKKHVEKLAAQAFD